MPSLTCGVEGVLRAGVVRMKLDVSSCFKGAMLAFGAPAASTVCCKGRSLLTAWDFPPACASGCPGPARHMREAPHCAELLLPSGCDPAPRDCPGGRRVHGDPSRPVVFLRRLP